MIYETLYKYHVLTKNDNNHRFRSWEHCYNFFSQNYHNLKDEKVLDNASLHLAFYLASWGMLRGSSFLLQKDYKIHLFFIKKVVMNPKYFYFYTNSSSGLLDYSLIDGIDDLKSETKKAYEDNIREINGQQTIINVTDTLASKILLGVYGNVPAYDRYFKEALSLFGIKTQFNQMGLRDLIDFYNKNIEEFKVSQDLLSDDGVNYTPMKLIDMFFWQVGYMMDNIEKNIYDLKKISDFAAQYKHTKRNVNTVSKLYAPIAEKKVMKKGLTDDIRKYIIAILDNARENGKEYLDLRSGDIHKEMGLKDRLPSVCGAMESIPVFKYTVIKDTPSGKSSTKVLRYFLSS